MEHETLMIRFLPAGRALWWALERSGRTWKVASHGAGRDAEIPRARRVVAAQRIAERSDPDVRWERRLKSYKDRSRTAQGRVLGCAVIVSDARVSEWLTRIPQPGEEWPRGDVAGVRRKITAWLSADALEAYDRLVHPSESAGDLFARALDALSRAGR
jgi:hypothetical protein